MTARATTLPAMPIRSIYGARVTPTGTVLDPTGIPICTAPGTQQVPQAAFTNGTFLVVWDDLQNSASIYGARVRALDGAVLDTPFLVSQTLQGPYRLPQNNPAVAFDAASSSYLVAWNSLFYENGTVSSGILGIRIKASSGARIETNSFLVSRGGMEARIASASGSFLVA